MRNAVKALALLLVLAVSTTQMAGADDVGMAGREAQIAAAELARQNELLKAEIVRLRDEVGRLTLSLAKAKAEIDELGIGGRRAAAEATVHEAKSAGWLVADLNPDLKLAVIDAGRGSGLKQGMTVYVVRDGKNVARLRIVDVRERISGAAIEEIFDAGRPAKGDRVVQMTHPK